MRKSCRENTYRLAVAAALLLFWCAAHGVRAAEPGQPLTLESYLGQVTGKNDAVRSAVDAREGAALRAEEGKLLLAWTLIGNAQLVDDNRPTAVPAFQGSETIYNTYSLGLSKLTTFGLQAKIHYDVNYTSVYGTAPGFVTEPTYNDARPVLELSESLWSNGFGRATRAQQEAFEAQALATSYSSSYQTRVILSGAEQAYWRLAVAREVVQTQRESLDRAQKIYDWSARRVKLHLADRSDLLQADAALKLGELQLQSALDEEAAAARAFNTARGADSDQVPERLAELDPSMIDRLEPPKRAELREDVKAAREQERASVASSETAIENGRPTLDVYASYAFNGRDPSVSTALENDWFHRPTRSIGVRLSAPLDLGVARASRDGYEREEQGAERAYQRKLYEQDRDWDDLTHKLDEAKKRFDLSLVIERAQLEKLTNEKLRHQQGRTTTYQVLLFEQDYASAELTRIRAQADVLNVVAQMKTFGGAL